MDRATRFKAVSIGVVLLLGYPVSASAQSKDPVIGTWKQNVEKSRCVISATGLPCESPPRVPTTRVFEDLGGGFLFVSNDGVDAEGNLTGNRIVFRRDGNDYPIAARGQTGFVTIAFTTKSLNPFATEYLVKLDGEVTTRSTESLSADGNTYTTAARGTNNRGQQFTNVIVFERVMTPGK
jgi:hypothetical protein